MIALSREAAPPMIRALARVQLGAGAGADPLGAGLEPHPASPSAGLAAAGHL